MKKIIIIFLAIFLIGLGVEAKQNKNIKPDFANVIEESGIEKNSIAISIRELGTGKPVYELNEKILMHPASVQKMLTLPAAMDVLGENYEFKTTLYSRGEDEFVVKLGADPYLSSSDLKKIIKNIPQDTKKVYIDDSILEQKDWGEGWQWDDDLNVLMPRFNAYNLDKNLLKITIMPTEKGDLATIINTSKYPLVFFNNVKTGNKNGIKVTRNNSISANALTLNGTVNKPTVVTIPVNNLQRNFEVKFTNLLAERKVYMKYNLLNSTLKSSDKEIITVVHPVDRAIVDVLKSSNNLVSETLLKLAGGKYANDKGTDLYGIRVFKSYCEKLGIDYSRMRLADASGVSKNNLVSANFVSEFLVKNKDNKVYEKLPIPGEGTLTHRMVPLKDSLKAKTGTLSDISSIAGFLTTKSGNKYAFCIMINDPSSTANDMKTFEDYLIREAYLRL